MLAIRAVRSLSGQERSIHRHELVDLECSTARIVRWDHALQSCVLDISLHGLASTLVIRSSVLPLLAPHIPEHIRILLGHRENVSTRWSSIAAVSLALEAPLHCVSFFGAGPHAVWPRQMNTSRRARSTFMVLVDHSDHHYLDTSE